MYGLVTTGESKKPLGGSHGSQSLLGYVLVAKNQDMDKDVVNNLEDKCHRSGFKMEGSEWDVGTPTNPYRVGLWRVLRRLICANCEPRRMSFSLLNFDDFIYEALKPCPCRNQRGLDGLVVQRIDHITSDQKKGSALILKLASIGKHLIADDGICLSCCHPATKAFLSRGT